MWLAGAALAVMAVLPVAEIAARDLAGASIPGAVPFLRHLTLWVGFLGAAIAAGEGRLLALATGTFLPEGRPRRLASIVSSGVAAGITALLARAALDLVLVDRKAGESIAVGVPVWVGELILPVSFALIAIRLTARADPSRWGRAVAALGLLAGVVIGQAPEVLAGEPVWPGIALVLIATVLGAPIFVLLGGLAVLLFLHDGVPASAVPAETYRLAVSPSLAAVPLFTLAGFILAEGGASRRLLRVFNGLVGWMPGGTAVVAAVVCAFFTAFTGGSGVTILALGGLLFPMLVGEGYRDRFTLGLLTASGSLGLLFPPSLPLILYGIVAGTPIEDLFLAGLAPGLLLLALTAAWGVREGRITRAGRTAFSGREAVAAIRGAAWELILPVVVLAAIFSGLVTLVEAAAVTALYAWLVEGVIHREVRPRDLPRVMGACVSLVGGVLVILGAAMGFTSWMVDAEVPARLATWTIGHVSSPWLFLLLLNGFLLVVGCLMDIFSAIVVVVPLIAPLGAAFGIDPVHLGIVFVANLELGYMTPPVGLNLFLSSYRFERPLLEVYRATVPMLLIQTAGVLLITYVPALTTGVLRAFAGPTRAALYF